MPSPRHGLMAIAFRSPHSCVPFCRVTLRGYKPPNPAYPRELRTPGDHLSKRRLDLGLRQKDVAQRLCVNVNTETNWELGQSGPALWFVPRITKFLGYVPGPAIESSSSLGARRARRWPIGWFKQCNLGSIKPRSGGGFRWTGQNLPLRQRSPAIFGRGWMTF